MRLEGMHRHDSGSSDLLGLTRLEVYPWPMDAGDLHRQVQNAFNSGDADALVALYEEDAVMAAPGGEIVRGREAIREQWEGFIALGGTITMVTRHAIEVGDTALLSNDWHFVGACMELSSRTSEVAHRQNDGTWKYVVDHPYSGADLALP
jgi:uncharacterized protein (TIGR02246 family)